MSRLAAEMWAVELRQTMRRYRGVMLALASFSALVVVLAVLAQTRPGVQIAAKALFGTLAERISVSCL